MALDMAPDKFGELRESNDILDNTDSLKQRMKNDGYLFFRKLIDPDVVLEARREILTKYAIIGEIDSIENDVMDAIYQEDSFIQHVNMLAFAESVREGKAYEAVTKDKGIMDFYKKFLDGDVHCFDFKWPRFVRPGEGCGIHSDVVYVGRGTRNLWSSWIPIGNVSKEEGALVILENSHKSTKLAKYWDKDADEDKIGWLSTDPLALQKSLGGRWLTTDFEAGDVICFSIYLAHAALDNNSPENRCRLTSDTRYQLLGENLDERWNGDLSNPHGDTHPKAFLPGLVKSDKNKNFEEEWKTVDKKGRVIF